MKKEDKLKRDFCYMVDQQCSYRMTVKVGRGDYPIVVTDGWSGGGSERTCLKLSKAMALKLSAILFTSAIDLPNDDGPYPGQVIE